MTRYLVLTTEEEFKDIISGENKYLMMFFKKRVDSGGKLAVGDVIFLKKNKEVVGQFEVGRLIFIENLEFGVWNLVREIVGMKKEVFEEKARENSILVAVRIDKLEQLITSPIEIPKGRKEWVEII